MSRRKKLLGLLMAVGMSVSMCVTPVLAETTSILDEIPRKNLRMKKLQKIFPKIPVTVSFEEPNLNFGNVKIQKVNSGELAIFGLTQCHKKCAKVYLSLFLERKVNGSYSTYKIFEYTGQKCDKP